jgi:hypothetical protein
MQSRNFSIFDNKFTGILLIIGLVSLLISQELVNKDSTH